MKTNIVLVSLHGDLAKKSAKRLADKMDMYYLDVEELLKYNLESETEIKKLCGQPYLAKQKTKVLSSVYDYENSYIYLPVALFLEGLNAEKLRKKSNIVFLQVEKKGFKKFLLKGRNDLSKTAQVEVLAFDLRNDFCKKHSDIIVKISDLNQKEVYEKTLKAIDKYLV